MLSARTRKNLKTAHLKDMLEQKKKQTEQEHKQRHMLTPSDYSAIVAKEDQLEQIMCAEAYAGFEQMGRYQLNKRYMTRVGVNPDAIHVLNYEKLNKQLAEFNRDQQINHSEDYNDDTHSEFEADLPDRVGLEAHHWQPGDEDALDETFFATLGLRIGMGYPVCAEPVAESDLHADWLFVGKCGDYGLFGVVNGHGHPACSAELAQYIAEKMPQTVFSNRSLAQGGDVAEALTKSFTHLHNEASQRFDLRLTGASCSVCLVDHDFIWVAHVGDCRAVLGVADPLPNAEAFHYQPAALTKDHNLSLKAEFDRVHEYDGEKRRLMNDNVYRLFVRDSDVPGLTLTRSIGHIVGHMVGVKHTPTVSGVNRRDMADESFLVLGSGGIWATMSEKSVVNWVSKYYQNAHDAAESLANEAHHRWETPGCKARSCLSHTTPDCFSLLVVYFHEAPPLDTGHEEAVEKTQLVLPPLEQRSFLVGPNKHPGKPWHQVKCVDRTIQMRRTQANGRALGEDFTWGPKRELALTDWAVDQFNTHRHIMRDRV